MEKMRYFLACHLLALAYVVLPHGRLKNALRQGMDEMSAALKEAEKGGT